MKVSCLPCSPLSPIISLVTVVPSFCLFLTRCFLVRFALLIRLASFCFLLRILSTFFFPVFPVISLPSIYFTCSGFTGVHFLSIFLLCLVYFFIPPTLRSRCLSYRVLFSSLLIFYILYIPTSFLVRFCFPVAFEFCPVYLFGCTSSLLSSCVIQYSIIMMLTVPCCSIYNVRTRYLLLVLLLILLLYFPFLSIRILESGLSATLSFL
jgi:hypothetical protein